jgi:hypothetical protein
MTPKYLLGQQFRRVSGAEPVRGTIVKIKPDSYEVLWSDGFQSEQTFGYIEGYNFTPYPFEREEIHEMIGYDS